MQCLICGVETEGSTGAAGLRWPNICQRCKDREDAAYKRRVDMEIKARKMFGEGIGNAPHQAQFQPSPEAGCCAHVWRYEPSTWGNYRHRHCDKCGRIEYNGRDGEWPTECPGPNAQISGGIPCAESDGSRLVCDQCGTEEMPPYDEGDACICGGQFKQDEHEKG